MSLFDVLFIGHLIGDFLFQTSWMAQYKSTRWLPLTVHVCVYTLAITLVAWTRGGIPVWAIAFIWVTHFCIDRVTLGAWWAKNIQRARRPADAWLNIVADQILHLIVLAIVATIV